MQIDKPISPEGVLFLLLPSVGLTLLPESNEEPVDYNFYRTFWSLHTYFQNFQLLFQQPDKWNTFVRSIELVLAAFEGNSNLEDIVQSQNHYFTKYLTSPNLMKLQVFLNLYSLVFIN